MEKAKKIFESIGCDSDIFNLIIGYAHDDWLGWVCEKCLHLSETDEVVCSRCSELKPYWADGPHWRKGDWFCPKCKKHQFMKRKSCRDCGAMNPKKYQHFHTHCIECGDYFWNHVHKSRARCTGPSCGGDWYCWCTHHKNGGGRQFASHSHCRACGKPRPKSTFKCYKCGSLWPDKRCKKCNLRLNQFCAL